jgi:hypothetical protein
MNYISPAFLVLCIATLSAAETPTFEKDIRPLFTQKCGNCHGADVQEAQLDLRTVSEILRGGENGPAIQLGKPESSLLVDILERSQMPPGKKNKLTLAELDTVKSWVKAGAPTDEKLISLPPHGQVSDEDRRFWAFQPPRKAMVPTIKAKSMARSPIDAFLLAKLEAVNLSFSPEADRQTLIRRLYFDLLGLPPSPGELNAFLNDPRPDAYERLVDELLKSPHYGERWGRHWLDAAGYVDGKLDNDLGSIYPNNGIWRYRDYVVQSFNQDKPFDRFLLEQIAGDELVDWRKSAKFDEQTVSLLTATGFLRNVDDHTDFPQYGIAKRYEVINETIDMFSTAVLGLTMECSRCHNHKYDPLPQRDYYRLMACFEPAFNVNSWKQPKDRYLADVSPSERSSIDHQNAEIDSQVAVLLKSERDVHQKSIQRLIDARFQSIPEVIRIDVKTALNLAANQRNEIQKYLAQKFHAILQIPEKEVIAALSDAEKASIKNFSEKRALLVSQKKSYGVIQALWDVGQAPLSHIHRRGNVNSPGVLVQPGFPEILQPKNTNTSVSAVELKGESSGRRLALGKWLIHPDHPLTARVWVNRVWHHHFGRGIVETLGNFGRSGSPPTHPELLDWLAVDFIKNGWSTMRLHRQILLSRAYRQSTRRKPDGSKTLRMAELIDPDNRLLSRMNLQRMDAEILRDAILAVSGELDKTRGGPPIEITSPPDGLSVAKSAPTSTSGNRRSIYLFARRVYPLKFLEIFDSPIMPVNCTQRTTSATVLQSLVILNSDFVIEQSGRLADKILKQVGEQPDSAVRLAYQQILSRSPNDEQTARSLRFLDEQSTDYIHAKNSHSKARRDAIADLCQMLIASNEFLYVE